MIFIETIKRKINSLMTAHKQDINSLMAAHKKEILFRFKSELLRNAISTCKDSGITTDRIADKGVVVSLTTYGKRLYTVSLAIESIMQGTMKPNRLILWLQDDLKNEPLPYSLHLQMLRGLEVRYTKDIKSYKKLVPTLKLCPDSAIVTIDDDALYEADTLERLVGAYNKDPHFIYASRIRKIALNIDGSVETYSKWENVPYGSLPSNLNLPIGKEGVLYPPGSLSEEVFDADTFMKFCPKGDDLWFWLMAKKNKCMGSKIYTHEKFGFDSNSIGEVQDIALYKTNISYNDIMFKSLIENCQAGKYLTDN